MPGLNRSLAMPQDEVGVYHCFNRCVQQAFLCGFDREHNVDYSHRKVWMREKLRRLARAFAVDVFKYSLMGNHLHLLLRNRPDLVAEWTDEELARRWWEVCPERVEPNGMAAEPKPLELAHWLSDPDMMRELRSRLSNPSWLMRIWCGHIGRRANQETGKSGRFFEERFKSVRLLDEAAVLACALYIDLNPIRACLAETPEQSEYTSVHDRIAGRKQRLARAQSQRLDVAALTQNGGLALDVSCADPSDADAWLSRLTLDTEQRLNGHLAEWFDGAEAIEWEDLEEHEPDVVEEFGAPLLAAEPTSHGEPNAVCESVEQRESTAADGTLGETSDRNASVEGSTRPRRSSNLSGLIHFPAPRASNKGFLSLTFDEYLELLDWTGRQLHPGKRGAIPESAPPILERLGIHTEGWLKLIDKMRHWRGVAVGHIQRLEKEAARVGRNWLWRRREMADAFG